MNKNVSFEPNDVDFPAVGTIRKKPKLSQAPVVPPVQQPPEKVTASEKREGGHRPRPSPSAGYQLSKHAVVDNWLKSVQQPVAGQSQQVPVPPPVIQQATSSSAPNMNATKQRPQFKPSADTGKKITPTQKCGPRPAIPKRGNAPVPVGTSKMSGTPQMQPLPDRRFIHAGDGDAATVLAPSNDRNHNAYANENPHPHGSQRSSGRNERRIQRERFSDGGRWTQQGLPRKLPSELTMQTGAVSNSTNNGLSVVPVMQQAAASCKPVTETQSQVQLSDVATCSTLNWNASEFLPSQSTNSDLNQFSSQETGKGNGNMISERRRRQRFYRSLKSNTLFELAMMPEPRSKDSQPSMNNQELMPTYNVSSSYNQSVFRLASLPITGIGTRNRSGSNTLSTIDGPCDSQMETDINMESHPPDSPPLLDMDPPTQPDQITQFLESDNNLAHVNVEREVDLPLEMQLQSKTSDNKDLARHVIFVGGKRRHVVDVHMLPPSIKALYGLICNKYSDFAFIYALSAQISENCVPMECYVYLKMTLLYSLVSFNTDKSRKPISLCVISNDNCVAHRLLENVGQLAPRFVGPHEGGQQVAHTALPTRYNWVQASPLLLAQHGVYYVGDWNRLARDQSEELEKCIENGNVPVPELHNEQPLESAIWTYWLPENATNQSTTFAKLCPIFGLLVNMDELVNNAMFNFVLRQHSRDSFDLTKDALHIPTDDMRTLISLLIQRQVVYTVEAEQLLKKYFVVSRIERPAAFSSNTYIVLKQFGESHAKLAMRLDVLVIDVVVAIFHCENFVRNIFGAGDNPPPAVKSFNVISKVDTYMNEFARWVFQSLDRYEDDVIDKSEHLNQNFTDFD